VLLLVEESFVPQRQSMKIPLPLGSAVVSVDFPLYQHGAYAPMALDVREKNQSLGMSALAVSVQALAYRDLKEKIPGIVVRNVTRAAVRLAAQEVARAQNSDALSIAVLAVSAAATAINRADTRAWYTLPMAIQLYRGRVAPGNQIIEVRNQVTGFVTRVPVTVAQGETRIVWMADLGGNARVATASLNGKGSPSTYQVCGSMLAGYPPVTLPGGPRTLYGMCPR